MVCVLFLVLLKTALTEMEVRVQGQIDGNIVSAQFILVPRKKATPPPVKRAISPPPRREIVRRDTGPRDGLKDGPRRRDCK